MAHLKRMEEMRDRIYSCVGVGDCKMALKGPYSKPIAEATCPLLQHGSGFEVYFARGRFSLARAMLKGQIEASDGLAQVIYSCTLCGGCREVCNNCENVDWSVPARENIGDHTEVWEAMRGDLVDAGVAPMPRHKEIMGSVIKDHNPYFQDHKNRLNWIPNTANITKNSPILFFVGCTGAYKLNEMPKNFLEISAKAGLKMQIAGEEWCCGSVAFRCGVEDIAKQLAEHNAELMKTQKVKTIVTSCAGCYRVFKKDYPKVLGTGKWNVDVLHTIEMVDKLIKEGKLKVIKKIEGNITYHDPCHLGRHTRIFDAPRDVIKAITKGALVEMRRNRSYAYCCGAGGGVKSGFPDLALEIAQERIKEAEQTKAKFLVTTCPFCLTNLRDAAKSLNSKLEILDLLELVNKAT